jgi:hypothetical protein
MTAPTGERALHLVIGLLLANRRLQPGDRLTVEPAP